MVYSVKEGSSLLSRLIESELKPKVKAIDCEAFYAESFLKSIGANGFLSSDNKSTFEYLRDEMNVVEEVSKICMTTAFCLWCHLAALTYVRNTDNLYLKEKLLPALESGEILGATGLSNPMKYYAGLEKLHLRAKPVDGGYVLSGALPAVSNLGPDHWFGVIAEVSENERIMGIVPCSIEGLELKERTDYLGLNGSATYSCLFDDVFLSNEWIVSEDADAFVQKIRPAFLLYQIPLGFGVTRAAIGEIERVEKRQNGCNKYLRAQASDLKNELDRLRQRLREALQKEKHDWKEIASIRLDAAYLTLQSTQMSMLHNGSGGYLRDSGPSRQLREAYFFANLTPTVKHLEKVLQS